MQLEYLKDIIDCRKAIVWGRSEASLLKYLTNMKGGEFDITITQNIDDVIDGCQLVVTCTPAETPLISRVNPGTHITAMGSDTLSKQELNSSILLEADLVVADSKSQCEIRGEIHQAIKLNRFSMETVVELGEIINGDKEGRTSEKQITIADLTGVAVQDIQISKAVLSHL